MPSAAPSRLRPIILPDHAHDTCPGRWCLPCTPLPVLPSLSSPRSGCVSLLCFCCCCAIGTVCVAAMQALWYLPLSPLLHESSKPSRVASTCLRSWRTRWIMFALTWTRCKEVRASRRLLHNPQADVQFL
ncbi:hypothetical protein DFH06DRAFT_1479431 [Mycena polygramma]|nr:hypothetical protein DFH06DRAFT_1479431 [Mycena polygramma]